MAGKQLAGVSRDRAVAAALECFVKYGIDKTSMQDVAAAAHISRKTLYRHFSDRSALVDAAVESKAAEFADRTRDLIENAPSAADAVIEYLALSVDVALKDEVVMTLLSPTLSGSTRSSFFESPVVQRVMRDCWIPLFRRDDFAALPVNVTVEEAVEWIANLQVSLVTDAVAGGPQGEQLRRYLTAFVAPAFRD